MFWEASNETWLLNILNPKMLHSICYAPYASVKMQLWISLNPNQEVQSLTWVFMLEPQFKYINLVIPDCLLILAPEANTRRDEFIWLSDTHKWTWIWANSPRSLGLRKCPFLSRTYMVPPVTDHLCLLSHISPNRISTILPLLGSCLRAGDLQPSGVTAPNNHRVFSK